MHMSVKQFIDMKRRADNCVVSLYGADKNLIPNTIKLLSKPWVDGIEFNCSCPNVDYTKHRYDLGWLGSKNIQKLCSNKKLYLKLNYKQDPYDFWLDHIDSIRLNSVPFGFCDGSGKIAQKYNWPVIGKWIKEGLPVSGCSVLSWEDVSKLEDLGCTEIGIGCATIISPRFVESIKVK